jgi:hypothetical protein
VEGEADAVNARRRLGASFRQSTLRQRPAVS